MCLRKQDYLSREVRIDDAVDGPSLLVRHTKEQEIMQIQKWPITILRSMENAERIG